MKALKISLLSLLIVICLCFSNKRYTGNWAGISSSQFISYEDVQNGISTGALTAYGTDPALSATKWITSAELKAWVMLSNAPSNASQWCTKNTITIANAPYSFSILMYNPPRIGFANMTDACAHVAADTLTLYSTTSTPVVGTALYEWSGTGLLVPFASYTVGAYSYYYPTTSIAFQMTNSSSNIIASTQSCLTEVYIAFSTVYISPSGTANLSFSSYSDAGFTTPINVDTNVTISWSFYDDLSIQHTGTTVMTSGTNSISATVGVNPAVTTCNTNTITGFSPNPSSGQHYN